MSGIKLSHLSRETLRYPVVHTVDGGPVNPTTDVVQFAFLQPGVDPTDADWRVGDWHIDLSTKPTTYYARVKLGPGAGAVQLVTGRYKVWIKISDNDEIPIRAVGSVTIT